MSGLISLGSCGLIRQGLFLCDPQVLVRVRFGFALWCEGWRLYLYPPLEASPLLTFFYSHDMRSLLYVVRDFQSVLLCSLFVFWSTFTSRLFDSIFCFRCVTNTLGASTVPSPSCEAPPEHGHKGFGGRYSLSL